MQDLKRFLYFISEREAVRTRKEAGEEWPWTRDTMLQEYRFCNIRREDDRETRWIASHWRRAGDPQVWFAMCVARLVNWAPSLEEVGYPVPWNPKRFKRVMSERATRGEQTFTGAYMINQTAQGGKGLAKADYLADVVLAPLWADRGLFAAPGATRTLADFHELLTRYRGMGSFMAGQVVADTKYTPVLSKAHDWHTWAASGPGSRRGLNVLLGRSPDAPWAERDWFKSLTELRGKVNSLTPFDLHAQDVQNCLCEYFKYTRGSSRSRYKRRAT